MTPRIHKETRLIDWSHIVIKGTQCRPETPEDDEDEEDEEDRADERPVVREPDED